MENEKKRKRGESDFRLAVKSEETVEEEPRVIKMGVLKTSRRAAKINRRTFLRGGLTAGAAIAGVAATIGSGDDGGGSGNAYDSTMGVNPEQNSQYDHLMHGEETDNGVVLAYHPDGSVLISGGDNGLVKTWDPSTGELLRTYSGHAGSVRTVACSPDGTLIASAGDAVSQGDGVHLCAGDTGNLLRTFTGHEGGVNCVAFSQDASMAVSGCEDGGVLVWNTTNGETVYNYTGHGNFSVLAVAFCPTASRVASGGYGGSHYSDGAVRVWTATTGELIAEDTGHASIVSSIAFTPDGGKIVSGCGYYGGDPTVRVWDIATKSLVTRYGGQNTRVSALAVSPDGTTVASASDKYGDEDNIHLWTLSNGDEVVSFQDASMHTVVDMAFSPDGSALAISDGHKIAIWNLTTQQALYGHCTCDMVCTCNTDEICVCDSVCTCNSQGSGHYWYSN